MDTSPRPVFLNPVTKERAVVLTDPRIHPDRVLVAHLSVAPGGRVAAAHYHPDLEERFLILRGRVGFLIDGRERMLGPGEGARVGPGVVHDWWQVGDEEAQALVEVSPGVRFVEIVGTMFGLARDGKVNAKGMPGPLQLAVMGHEYRDTLVFTRPPRAIQKLVIPAMAAVGRLLGRRPVNEAYLEPSVMEEPDSAALSELTEDGRLRPLPSAGKADPHRSPVRHSGEGRPAAADTGPPSSA
jgi:mannose-6-phosphate isomerase-like protein (cupin superfamily)